MANKRLKINVYNKVQELQKNKKVLGAKGLLVGEGRKMIDRQLSRAKKDAVKKVVKKAVVKGSR